MFTYSITDISNHKRIFDWCRELVGEEGVDWFLEFNSVPVEIGYGFSVGVISEVYIKFVRESDALRFKLMGFR